MPDNVSPKRRFISELTGWPNLTRPGAYGIGRFGVGRFGGSRDKTRSLWERVAQVVAGVILALAIGSTAFAADTFTSGLNLRKPDVDVEDPDTPWGDKINNNSEILDAAICDKRTGCTIAGDLVSAGSMTATFFVGDGSFLTGIPAQVVFHREDLTAQADGATYNFTLSTQPIPESLHVVLDGLTQRLTADYTLSGFDLSMTTAPADDTYSFMVFYATTSAEGGGGGAPSGSFVQADAPILGNGTDPDHLRLDTSSVTLLGPDIDQSELNFAVATQAELDLTGAATAQNQVEIEANRVSTGVNAANLISHTAIPSAHHGLQIRVSTGLFTVQDVASLTDIKVATIAVTLNGGLFIDYETTIHIANSAGASRLYQISLHRDNGAFIQIEWDIEVRAGDHVTTTIKWFENSSTAGAGTYNVSVRSSSASGTQELIGIIFELKEGP